MNRTRDRLIGELLFRTKDGLHALVYVYRGKDTFRLRRMTQGGSVKEQTNVDVYRGDLNGYASEATLKWSDLDPESVELKPADWK